MQIDVQRDASVVRDRLKKFLRKFCVKVAHFLSRQIDIEGQMWPAADIEGYRCKGLVHRYSCITVPLYTCFISQSFPEGLPEADTNILDGVMKIDIDIAARLDVEGEKTVARHELQHMIEEGHGGRYIVFAAVVYNQRQNDIGFRRFSLYFGFALHQYFPFYFSAWPVKLQLIIIFFVRLIKYFIIDFIREGSFGFRRYLVLHIRRDRWIALSNGDKSLLIFIIGSLLRICNKPTDGVDFNCSMRQKNIKFPLAGKTAIKVHAVFSAERIDLRGLESAARLAVSPFTIAVGAAGCAVIFRYGMVVLFDVTPEEEKTFLEELGAFMTAPFDSPASDAVDIRIRKDAGEGLDLNFISLKRADLERIQIVAEVLSRSVVLDHYAGRVSRDFDSIEPLALSLKRRTARSPGLREPLRHIGSSLLSLHKMVGRVEVTEKPELLWENPELERLYARLEDEYEISERHLALERKLELVSRTAETLLDLIQTKRSLRVEWYIVILIVVEILLTLYELFIR